MIKNKNILITGGAGFIGSHLFEHLITDNYVVVIDNFNRYYEGKEEQFNAISNRYEPKKDYALIKGNLVDKSTFELIDCEIDYIFHLAAQAGVRFSIENAANVTTNNIVSTVNVFEYAKERELQKIVFASSSSVYGNPEYTPLDEDHPKNPISPYSVSKLCCEDYADYYYREYNLPITCLRFYTVYGPRGRPDMAIRKFFELMSQNKELTIYGDGNQKRDFTYISDIVNGMVLAAENEKISGQPFNLGYSSPISVNDLIELMYKITGRQRQVRYVEKQQGDVDITYSDTRKANKLLNYYPKVSIELGLQKTHSWQENQYRSDKK